MKKFLYAAAVRAMRTMAQTALAIIGTGVVMQDVDWPRVGSATLLAGILCFLTSFATGLPEVDGHGNG